jgi:hypothetical protein
MELVKPSSQGSTFVNEGSRESDRISLFISAGVSDDVNKNYILEKTDCPDLELVSFSSKKLSWGHYCNWTIFLSEGEDWNLLQADVINFLANRSGVISRLPVEFDRRISLESYLYKDFHFEVDFSIDFLKFVSDLGINLSVGSYFLGNCGQA